MGRIGWDQRETPRELEAQCTEHGAGDRQRVSDDKQRVAHLRRKRRFDRVNLSLRQELRDRRAKRAVLLDERPDQALGAVLLGELGQRVQVGARQFETATVHAQDGARSPGEGAGENLELRRPDRSRQIMQLQTEPPVGPVRAPAAHRLGPGDPRPGSRRNLEALGNEHGAEDRLHQLDHVVLLDERHLDVELGEFRQAVGTGILVAEAANDLVVALKAADHQKLLEQLWGLGQRVEQTRFPPSCCAGGHQEVASALRRRARQKGGLDLQEVAGVQHAAHLLDHAVAQLERLAHRRTAQVQAAVTQAQVLVDGTVLIDLERRRLSVGEDLNLSDVHLDLASGQIGVDVLRLARDNAAGDGDHVLRAETMRGRVSLRCRLGMEDQLHQARAVAQVDEDQSAVVAAAVHETGDARDGAGALPR